MSAPLSKELRDKHNVCHGIVHEVRDSHGGSLTDMLQLGPKHSNPKR